MRIHYPLASSISKTMSSLLFGEEVVIKVDTGNKKVSDELNKRLWMTLEDNDYMQLFQKGAQMESYSGSLGAKILIDTEFSEYPQIQFYPQEQIELNSKYSRVVEIVFKDEHEYRGTKYVLRSIYGRGYIRYELVNHKKELVPLSKVPELEELKDIVFLDPDGQPLQIMMAVFKPNRTVSSNFINTNYGASDYEGLYPTFNAVDELLSVWNDHYRNGRITTFLTEDQLKRNPRTGDIMNPDIYGINKVILVDSDATLNNNTEVKRDIPNLNVQAFEDGFHNYIKIALQRTGLSPVTFGMDFIPTLASQESLQEREKTTLKTRQDKIKLWTEFFRKLARLLFIYDEASLLTPKQGDSEMIYNLTRDWNYDYLVEWAQYDSPSKEEQIRTLGLAMDKKLIDIDTAFHVLYDDEYSAEEIDMMIMRAKGINEPIEDEEDQNPITESDESDS
jgi:hypothetical protein